MRVLDSFGRITAVEQTSRIMDGWVFFSVKLCVYLHTLRICWAKLPDSESGWSGGGGGGGVGVGRTDRKNKG